MMHDQDLNYRYWFLFVCFVLVLDYILHVDKQIRTGAEIARVIGEQGIYFNYNLE